MRYLKTSVSLFRNLHFCNRRQLRLGRINIEKFHADPPWPSKTTPGSPHPLSASIVFSEMATAPGPGANVRETVPQSGARDQFIFGMLGVAQVFCRGFPSLGGSGGGFRSFFEPRPDLGAAFRKESPRQAQDSPKKAQGKTLIKIQAPAAGPTRAAGCRSRRRSGRACLACSETVSGSCGRQLNNFSPWTCG